MESEVLTAFEKVKSIIGNCNKLFHPQPSAKIAITTDASNIAMGATLEQFVQGVWQPPAYFSKAWFLAQKKYVAYDKELLSIVKTLKYYRYYIDGKDIIFTDHKPLIAGFLKKSPSDSVMQQRHFSFISEFTTDIRHLPGKDNVMADIL